MSTEPRSWGGLAFATAVVALGVAAYALLRPAPERGGAPGDEVGASPSEIRELRGRIEGLEKQTHIAELRPPAPPPGLTREEAAELERRLDAVEKAVPARPASAPVAPEPPPVVVASAGELQATAVDARLDERERVKALKALRALGPEGRTHEVVVAMIDLLKTSKDARVRTDVIRHLHGTKDPDLVAPMIDAMTRDADEGVREKAADDIDDFVGDPRVIDALKRVVEDPTTPVRVRQQAASTLAKASR